MGWAARNNGATALRERVRQQMFAPVLGVDGKAHYVNPTLIRSINAGLDLPIEDYGPAPDGTAWPSSWLNFTDEHTLHVKGSPEMILGAWFGRPSNEPRKIVVVPPGSRIVQ